MSHRAPDNSPLATPESLHTARRSQERRVCTATAPRYPLAIAAALCVLASLFSAETASAQVDLESDLPTMTTMQDVDEIDARLRGVIVPLRSRTDLGRGFRPRFQDGDGAATLVRFDDERTGWVSAHAHLAQADEIEILINGEWISCDTAHGTIMFDLVQLVPERDSTEHDRALPLAESWPLDGTLFTHVANPPESEAELVFMGLGEPPEEPWNYYVRVRGALRNGFPLVSRDGYVIAIASIAAPDRPGGVLAIPFTMFNTWVEEWPQLTDGPIGWEPRVVHERVQPTTGSDAIRGTNSSTTDR